MSLPDVQKLELLIEESQFFYETGLQIQKDFNAVDVDFSLEHIQQYPELLDLLESKINRLLELDTSTMFRFLYLVDIDEQRVKKALFDVDKTHPAKELALLILKRELMKVVIRNHFKAQE